MEWNNNGLLRLPADGEGSGSSPGFGRLLCLSVVVQTPVSLLIYSMCCELMNCTSLLCGALTLMTSFSIVSRIRGFPEESFGFLHIKALNLDEDLYEVIHYIDAVK